MLSLSPGSRNLLSNGVVLAAGNWADALLRLLAILVLTRNLGPDSYGIWVYAIAISGLALGAVSLGMDRLLPIGIGRRREHSGQMVVDSGMLKAVAISAGAAAILSFALIAEPTGAGRASVLIVSFHFIGRALYSWVRPVFVGLEKPRLIMGLTVATRCVELIALTAVFLAGGGLLAGLITISAFACIEAVLAIRLVRRMLPDWPFPALAGIRTLLFAGAILGAADLLTQWLMTGPLILLRQLSPDMALFGQIALVFQVTTLAVATFRPFVMAALPGLGRAHEQQDARMYLFGRAVAVVIFFCLGAGAIVAWFIGPDVIPFAFGADFRLAGHLLAPAVLVGLTVLLPLGYESLLIIHGKRLVLIVANAVGAVTLLLTAAPAVELWGPTSVFVSANSAWGVRAAIIVATASTLIRART